MRPTPLDLSPAPSRGAKQRQAYALEQCADPAISSTAPAIHSSQTPPSPPGSPRSRTHRADHHLVRLAGRRRLLTSMLRGSGGARPSHAGTLPIPWLAQACGLSQAAGIGSDASR
nr:unnamed protein product [Leishmania braziliensis]